MDGPLEEVEKFFQNNNIRSISLNFDNDLFLNYT